MTIPQFTLRGPCKHCPFRNDRDTPFFYDTDRAVNILDGMELRTFPCHLTTPFDKDGRQVVTKETQACAGALILMQNSDRFPAGIQILTRLGEVTLNHLRADTRVYSSASEFVRAAGDECRSFGKHHWWV